MRKKDYELIGSVVKWAQTAYGYGESERNAVRQVGIELADTFGDNYPKFDRNKFLTACGIVDPIQITGQTNDEIVCIYNHDHQAEPELCEWHN